MTPYELQIETVRGYTYQRYEDGEKITTVKDWLDEEDIQIISNVPFVALFQPLLINPSAQDLMALAAGSTIAGNLFILGAASNVIIIQNAEKSGETLTFLDFARVGVPLTALNVFVYWIFL